MKRYLKPEVKDYRVCAVVMDTTSVILDKETTVDPSNALSKGNDSGWGNLWDKE